MKIVYYSPHLKFVDDTLLFSSHENRAMHNVFDAVQAFEGAFGLNINPLRLEIFGINIEIIPSYPSLQLGSGETLTKCSFRWQPQNISF